MQKDLKSNDQETVTMVFDVKQKRPACVLLQAAFGCGESNGFLQMNFDSRDWLVVPTQDMRKIPGTKEQWKTLAAWLDRKRNEKRA